MKPDWPAYIRSAVLCAVNEALSVNAPPSSLRLPAKADAAAVYVGSDAATLAVPAPDKPFGELFCAPLIANVSANNGWLLLTFSDAFYSSAASEVIRRLPVPDSDLGSLALNRMLALSKKARCGCPEHASVQRALLVCLLIGPGVPVQRAERAVRNMFYGLQPGARAALAARSGDMGDAAARLLYSAILPERNDR